MKNLILTTSLILTVLFTFSQEKKYNQVMEKTIAKMQSNRTSAEFYNSANSFELISKNHPKQWLATYYYVYNCINASFTEKEIAKKDQYLDLAEKSLKSLIQLNPTESEVFALEAYFYTARLVVNPMSRGQKYSGLSAQAVAKSLQLDPLNPRANYLKISNEFGMAQFFGSNTETFCNQAKELIKNWDTFIVISSIHPTWGKSGTVKIASSCQTKPKKVETKNTEKALTIHVKKLRSSDGKIKLKLLNEKEEVIQLIEQPINNKECLINITDLQEGKYSIQYYHDENNNGKLDTGNYGKPTEGYGFSNDARGFMAAPKFDKTLFEFKEKTEINLTTTY